MLNVPAPGLLGNDADPDGDTLTLDTTPVTGPAHGQATMLGDGAYTYSPGPGFTGADSFTYRISDLGGLSTIGTASFTVTAAPTTTGTLYFQDGDPLADVWSLATGLPAAAPPLTDFDADNHPGLTIKHSNGSTSNTEHKKFHTWTYTTPATIALNGPVQVDLWSSAESFTEHHDLAFFVSLRLRCGRGQLHAARLERDLRKAVEHVVARLE